MSLTGLGEVADFAKDIADKLIPDKEQSEKDAAALTILKLTQQYNLVTAQTDIDKVEASNESPFVSGGRPFILWVCGCAFAYDAILEPLMDWVARVCFHSLVVFPVIDTTITMQVMFAMLGLGAFRSYDKQQTVAGKVSVATAKSLPPGAP